MRSDSETESESEPESSLVAWVPTCAQPRSQDISADDVVSAVDILQNVDLSEIPSNQDLQSQILDAFNAITRFLDSLLESLPEIVEELYHFALLVRPQFLSLLFAQRKIFHQMANKVHIPGTSASVVVCCVDSFLVKMADVTLVIASGSSVSSSTLPEGLKAQQEDDSLRASSQLPGDWQAFLLSLGSRQLSSAAKRLCLKIAFAVYIIAPSLDRNSDPWMDLQNPRPHELMKALDEYVLQESVDEPASMMWCDAISERKRLSYAMVLILFCATAQQVRPDSSYTALKPRTFGNLLELIHAVLGNGDSEEMEPVENLDAAQSFLLRWGNIVPWCWKTWSDPRIDGTDSIIRLTTTWLYHIDEFPDVSSIMVDSVLEDPSAAGRAIMRVLQQCFSFLPLAALERPATLPVVLSQVCQATLTLLRHYAINGGVYDPVHFRELAKYLLNIFVALEDFERSLCIKSCILESLTLLQREGVLHIAVTSLCSVTHKDGQVRFNVKLDDLILRMRKPVIDGHQCSTSDTEDIRITIHFLTLIWYNGAAKHIPRQSFTYLLRSLIQYSQRNNDGVLRDTVLTGFAIIGLDSTSRANEQEALWELFLASRHSNLGVAASFAYYIVTAGSIPDPLRCAEAWDHLRDTLTLIMRQHFPIEEEAPALPVCDLICAALVSLLQSSTFPVSLVLASPWDSLSLSSDLKAVLHSEISPEPGYRDLLQRRLASPGKVLLEMMSGKRKSNENGGSPLETTTTPKMEVQLILYHKYGSLIIFPATTLLCSSMNYRRRSQSASTSSSFHHRSVTSPPQSAIGKRSYFSSNHSHVSSSQNKWDIDAWQSKRRRRNVSPSGSGASSDDDFLSHFNRSRSPASRSALTTLSTPRSSFPSSSADFFPRNERSGPRLRHSTHIPASFDLNSNMPYSEAELVELRSNAFWDLQRSIAENGESLVRRMRDYESSRSRAETFSKVNEARKRGRKRSSLISAARRKQVFQDSEDDEDDEGEEDVQIISGEIPDVLIRRGSRPASPGDSSLAMTRGRSLPSTQRQRSPSSCSSMVSDDDLHMSASPTFPSFDFQPHSTSMMNTPALSHSTSSTNSSMVSLPLLPYHFQSQSQPSSHSGSTDINILPSIPSPTASRSEKALAALSLAMANGAGSINDYAGLYLSSIAQPDEHWPH
ncbi:hypothetical protein D9758_000142 [Tetrapyrgos nigripes]|uniref:Uncharacterized protein n=1 Tax=Tetrapyrgos nigripes TaxID=182062 RepID=A0A8H5H1R0_9AGAR|nr:hypothetical protein D9758_000142 [Tetrapyrgos nigripes]